MNKLLNIFIFNQLDMNFRYLILEQ